MPSKWTCGYVLSVVNKNDNDERGVVCLGLFKGFIGECFIGT